MHGRDGIIRVTESSRDTGTVSQIVQAVTFLNQVCAKTRGDIAFQSSLVLSHMVAYRALLKAQMMQIRCIVNLS
ncbi:hypothetical protein KAM576c_04780 [Enterobacter asburiae]|nr:hypothetical protein KAM576c_04780 [Enterobacter asburiae]